MSLSNITPPNAIIANVVVGPLDRSASNPSISFGASAQSNSGTGIYGDINNVKFCVNGLDVLGVSSSGLIYSSTAYSGSGSFQPIAPDLNVAAAAGSNDGSNPKYIAAIMGNILGDSLTKAANYLGGVIGAYSVTGVKATTYPSGAVLAQITDGVTDVDGAVVAYIDGDGSVTKANAAFKAMSNNSTAGSGFNYGVDLQGATHDGYPALAILKADIRTASGAVIMTGAGAPTNGTTGLNFAGRGSLYIDTTNGKLYITTAVSSSPTWVVVGSQS